LTHVIKCAESNNPSDPVQWTGLDHCEKYYSYNSTLRLKITPVITFLFVSEKVVAQFYNKLNLLI